MRPTLVTAPTSWAVSADEALAHCRMEVGYEDANLDRLIASAHRAIEEQTGRLMGAQTWRWKFRPVTAEVSLPIAPVSAITAYTYYDADNVLQTGSTGDLSLFADEDRPWLRPVTAWPGTYDRPDAVTLTLTAGMTTIPETMKHAMLMLIEHWNGNRASVADGQMREVPHAVEWLCALDRRAWVEA